MGPGPPGSRGPGAASMNVSHPDAEVAALRSCLRLPAPERGEVHHLGDPL